MILGKIYKITNKINNKVYIGQTKQKLQRRFRQHVTEKRHKMPISVAIQKYGESNFCIEEIFNCFKLEDVDYYESYFIQLYNTICPNGYNLSSGGTGLHNPTDETKRKMSIAKKGNTFRRNKKWSLQSKINFSRKQNGKTIIATNKTTKKSTIYLTSVEASEYLGCNSWDIIRCCKKHYGRKSIKNHTFEYYEENQSGSNEFKSS